MSHPDFKSSQFVVTYYPWSWFEPVWINDLDPWIISETITSAIMAKSRLIRHKVVKRVEIPKFSPLCGQSRMIWSWSELNYGSQLGESEMCELWCPLKSSATHWLLLRLSTDVLLTVTCMGAIRIVLGPRHDVKALDWSSPNAHPPIAN